MAAKLKITISHVLSCEFSKKFQKIFITGPLQVSNSLIDNHRKFIQEAKVDQFFHTDFERIYYLDLLKTFCHLDLRYILDGMLIQADRSSHRRCSIKQHLLKNVAKFTEKHPRQVSFLSNCRSEAYNFIEKEIPAQVFSYEFSEIIKNTFFTAISGRLLLN